MMKSRLAVFFLCLFSVLFAGRVTLYLFAAYRYKSGFSYGTVINGHACAGLSAENVNAVLLEDIKPQKITVYSTYGEESFIYPEDIGLNADFTYALENIIKDQNKLKWGLNLLYGKEGISLLPDYNFDRDKLDGIVKAFPVMKDYSKDRPRDIKIMQDDNGYYLQDSMIPVLNEEKVLDFVAESVSEGISEIRIPDAFFEKPQLTEAMREEIKTWDEVSKFIHRDIVYDMGTETIEVDSSVLSTFLIKTGNDFKRNEDGSLYIAESKIYSFIDNICNRYNNYGLPRTFTTINGEKKTVELSLYGTDIDRRAEKEYLLSAVKTGVSEVHRPKYIHEGYIRGLDDIGGTRIEIDITRQKLYYIKDGMVDMECDVVTGNPKLDRDTPEMVTSVIKKTRDTYLTGEDYRSFVSYWMAIYKKTIGIHDATWQKKFGGERYLTHGSRGCINMKLDEIKVLYDKVEVGIPVLVYK